VSVAADQFQGYQVDTSNRFSVLDSLDESVFMSPGSFNLNGPISSSSPNDTTRAARPAIIKSSASTDIGSDNRSSTYTSSKTEDINEDPIKAKRNNWRTLVINANSITGKKSSLEHLICYTNPDLILMTETKLGPNINTAEFMPENHDYTVYRRDRKQGGGGVLIAIKNNANCPSELVEIKDNTGEVLWIKIRINKLKTTYAGVFYRQPDAKVEQLDALSHSLNMITNLCKNNQNTTILLGGDFNCKDINWENNTISPESNQKAANTKLLEILADHGLTQHQSEPTRLESVLDLFCTNTPGLVKSMTTIPGISDHAIPVADCDIRVKPNHKAPRRVFCYSKADWESIKHKLSEYQTEFVACCNSRTVEENWRDLKKTLLKVMEQYIPSKLTKSSQNLPWWNRALQRLVRKKQRAYNKAKRAKQPSAWARFRSIQKDTQKTFNAARDQHLNKILLQGMQDQNNKPFWRYIKSRKQDNIGIAPLKSEGKLYSDSQSKAEILNCQFQQVFTREEDGPLPHLRGTEYPDIESLTVQCAGVAKLLSGLTAHKASGPDELPCRVLKELSEQIAPPLTFIFNQSLQAGSLPCDWLNANVAPIYKKGNKNTAENYRPVSLTSVCCKILEHIVLKHMLNHFEKHSILTSLQHGFRAAHSCVSQLVITIHDLMYSRDHNIQTDVIVLDFSKAFDTVPHNRLLHKINHYGIRGTLHKWIAAFLKNRQQRVVVDGAHSKWIHVDSGVPQGTVLGPLLFLSHINDLPSVVQSKCRLFADDCLLYREITSQDDSIALQEDLTHLVQWATTWGMHFNATKCQVLRLSRSKQPIEKFYTIQGHILEQVQSTKYLGVNINENLTWDTHIDSISSKANRTIGFLRRNLAHAPKELKELAYFSLVRSVLEYSCQVWDPYLKKQTDQLEMTQRRAARFVTQDYSSYSSVTSMLQSLSWISLSTRRRNHRLCLMFQISNHLIAIPPEPFLTAADNRTRAKHNKKYKVYSSKTEAFKNSFFPRTIVDWNSLPASVVGSPSLESFRSRLATRSV